MPPDQTVQNDWRAHLTDELKADPIVAKWSETASEKDIPSLIKGYAHTFTKQGNALHLPGKDAKPEDVHAFKQRLYEAGVFPAPPKDVKDYGIVKPEKLAEGFGWDDTLAKSFGETLLKHGASPALAKDLMGLYEQALTGTAKSLAVNREEALKTLKAEHGEKFDERAELVKRMVSGIFKSQEELDFFEETGLADHPAFLSVMMRLAPLAAQDSSFMETITHKGGEIPGEDAKAEYARVIQDKTHPHYAGFQRQDPKSVQYVDELYKRAYGTEKVTIGQGVGV